MRAASNAVVLLGGTPCPLESTTCIAPGADAQTDACNTSVPRAQAVAVCAAPKFPSDRESVSSDPGAPEPTPSKRTDPDLAPLSDRAISAPSNLGNFHTRKKHRQGPGGSIRAAACLTAKPSPESIESESAALCSKPELD